MNGNLQDDGSTLIKMDKSVCCDQVKGQARLRSQTLALPDTDPIILSESR